MLILALFIYIIVSRLTNFVHLEINVTIWNIEGGKNSGFTIP